MQITSFLQKFGRDLLYLSIIAGMMGWIWVDESRQEDYNTMIFSDMKNMGDIVYSYNEDLFAKISQNSAYYQGEKEDEFISKAILAKKQVDAYQEMVSKLMQTLCATNPKHPNDFVRSISGQELESLKVFTKKLCDSLELYSDHDRDVTLNLKHFLAQDSSSAFWKVAKSSKAQQTGVLMQDLLARTDFAYKSVLNYLLKNTRTPIGGFTKWLPVVSAEKSSILKGQTYTAEIFLSEYTESKMAERNTTIKVNGKQIPIKNGLVHFAQRYTTPGEKKYKVEIELKNPVTKHVTTLTKEFALLVIDSCR